MNKVRFSLSVLLANSSAFALKKLKGSEGTSLPGLIAMKCSNKFFQMAQRYCKKSIITVTGTNGKTTTAGILAHILQKNKNSVIHNENGANMLTGIASSLAKGLKTFHKKDYYVLECDEAYLTKLYNSLSANYLLVTNLFRDQLDRYGEVNLIYDKIQDAIDKNPDLKLILNADEPTSAMLGNKNPKIYYGIEDIFYHDSVDPPVIFDQNVTCKCGADFEYDKQFYAHIGHYKCSCGNCRKTPDYSAKVKIYSYKSEIIISHNNIQYGFTSYATGIYNVYNALGAIVAALELGIDKTIIQKALNTYEPVFGRTDRINLKGKDVCVQLIKNPVAMTEALRTVQNINNAKLLIAINDEYADGRDVSWLWDTDFSSLENFKNKIILSGKRAYDIALRLQYANVNVQKIKTYNNVRQAVNSSLQETKADETLVILPSYTVLLAMQKIFKEFANQA